MINNSYGGLSLPPIVLNLQFEKKGNQGLNSMKKSESLKQKLIRYQSPQIDEDSSEDGMPSLDKFYSPEIRS